MKAVLKISMILFLSVMVTGLFAQQRGGMRNVDPEESANQQLEQLKGIVKVEKKEEAKLKEVFLNSAKERQKARQDMQDAGDRTGIREIMQKLNTKRNEELKKLLGEKRMDKYLKELEKLRQERGNQRRI